jgi:hypothetical protein
MISPNLAKLKTLPSNPLPSIFPRSEEVTEQLMEETKQETTPIDFLLVIPESALKNLEPNLSKVCLFYSTRSANSLALMIYP